MRIDLRSELGRRKRLVEDRLNRFFEEKSRLLEDEAVRTPFEALRDLTMRGGKRIRAILVMIGHRFVSGDEPEEVLDPAAAMELLQSYLLIHDDVMDRSDTRRGGPTVHRMLEGAFEDPWLGVSLAITVGDLADAYAQQMILESDFPQDRVLSAMAIYNSMVEYTGYGQILDLLGSKMGGDIDYVLKTHLFKTSMYTFIGPLTIGAVLAGGSEEDLRALTTYGANAGIAFQLHDDYLGLFGEEEVIGKPATSDLEEGKRTVLVVEALRRASEKDRRFLEGVLGRRGLSGRELERAREIVRNTGALDASRELERAHLQAALEAIGESEGDDFSREFLVELARFSVEREA